MQFRLEHVHFMPQKLEAGVLYVSEEYETAAHLCPCGCGEKIRTPLGPTEWGLVERSDGPSLYPSVGNWHLPCRSHYWIRDGAVVWARDWTEEEIRAGRRREARRRAEHFTDRTNKRQNGLARIARWVLAQLRIK
jgi:hypothetical protein